MKDEIMAVDGPAASGKSVCEQVAAELHFDYLSTGPMYRLIALMSLRCGVHHKDHEGVEALTKSIVGRLQFVGSMLTLDGRPLTDDIYEETIGRLAPHISKQPAVRKLLLPLQRGFACGSRIVAEGRDMTSIVFLNAVCQIYLTADLEVRAERRYKQQLAKGKTDVTLAGILEDLRIRDHEDTTREYAPLIVTPRAIVIDSTEMTMLEVRNRMLEAWFEAKAAS